MTIVASITAVGLQWTLAHSHYTTASVPVAAATLNPASPMKPSKTTEMLIGSDCLRLSGQLCRLPRQLHWQCRQQ